MLDRGPDVLRDVATATNFGTQFAITSFVGYNFGSMIASNMMFDSRGEFSVRYPMKTQPRSSGLWHQSVAMAAYRALETETTVR